MNINEARQEVQKALRMYHGFARLDEVLGTVAQADQLAAEAEGRAAQAKADAEKAQADAANIRSEAELDAAKTRKRARSEFDDRAEAFKKEQAEADAWNAEWEKSVRAKMDEHAEWCQSAVAEQKTLQGAIDKLKAEKAEAEVALAHVKEQLAAIRSSIS